MGGGQDIQLANQGTATAPLNIHILGATATALRPSQSRHMWKKSMSGGGSTHYQRNAGHALLPGVYVRIVHYIQWIEQTVWP